MWVDLGRWVHRVSYTGGSHELKVEYYEHGGDAVAKLAIAP